ncbi:hypothetical protein BG004_004715 [Podila humilis]|nr:hypothetical protein BG004_004715 [Podila humilis]
MTPLPALTTLPPEINALIFHKRMGLTLFDIRACSYVCKAMNRIVSPFLWHTIRADLSTQIKTFRNVNKLLGLRKNAGSVQRLHLLYVSLYHIFLPPRIPDSNSSNCSAAQNENTTIIGKREDDFLPGLCSNLQELWLHQLESSVYDPYGPVDGMLQTGPAVFGRALEPSIIALIRQNPNISTLKIAPLTSYQLVQNILQALPHLQVLHLGTCLFWSEVKSVLESLPEGIKEVKILGSADSPKTNKPLQVLTFGRKQPSLQQQQQPQPHSSPTLEQRVKPHRVLETLELRGKFQNGQEEHILLPFLKSCSSNLKRFDVGAHFIFQNEPIRQVLAQLGIQGSQRLEHVHLPRGTESYDQEIANTIEFTSHWTEISLRCHRAHHQTVHAILTHSERLETLRLTHCTNLSSHDVQSILCTVKTLTVFETLDVKQHGTPHNPELYSHVLTESEWVATSLRVLTLMINIPRVRTVDWNCVSIDESISIQQAVCRQLGTLKKLERLELGNMFEGHNDRGGGGVEETIPESYYQHDCLELTIPCGLEELADLKELQILDISWMHHRIGVRELCWMDQHWPKLKMIRGFRETHSRIAGALAWISENRSSWLTPAPVAPREPEVAKRKPKKRLLLKF